LINVKGKQLSELKEIVVRVEGYGGVKAYVFEDKLIVKRVALMRLLNRLANQLNTKVSIEAILI